VPTSQWKNSSTATIGAATQPNQPSRQPIQLIGAARRRIDPAGGASSAREHLVVVSIFLTGIEVGHDAVSRQVQSTLRRTVALSGTEPTIIGRISASRAGFLTGAPDSADQARSEILSVDADIRQRDWTKLRTVLLIVASSAAASPFFLARVP